jgi:hypothetical protein
MIGCKMEYVTLRALEYCVARRGNSGWVLSAIIVHIVPEQYEVCQLAQQLTERQITARFSWEIRKVSSSWLWKVRGGEKRN